MKSKPVIRLKLLTAGIGLATLSGAAAAAPPKADAVHGQQVFARCAACHVIGSTPGTRMGPSLNGVFDRKAGTLAGYTYSAAMKKFGLKWDAPTLARFLQAPMKVVPGTKMAFPGLPNAQDQADVVAYLKQYRADGTKK
ncbi:c-type cytochrome [Sphingomonas sp. ASY06-1R]|uniref:c-type cytochrome n=1 Tax=Sphingomonas sp. ASY06-1R TaxID=3445771 RepID=UPI003FA2E049